MTSDTWQTYQQCYGPENAITTIIIMIISDKYANNNHAYSFDDLNQACLIIMQFKKKKTYIYINRLLLISFTAHDSDQTSSHFHSAY